jgi:hypothetical protein
MGSITTAHVTLNPEISRCKINQIQIFRHTTMVVLVINRKPLRAYCRSTLSSIKSGSHKIAELHCFLNRKLQGLPDYFLLLYTDHSD